MSKPLWHTLTVEAVCSYLNVTTGGLSTAEAERRLAQYGPNELRAATRISAWKLLLGQFRNVLIVILLIATALSAFLGHGIEAIATAVIVLFAAVLGFVQEYRAERAIEALRKMAAPNTTVVRDANDSEIPSRELVVGDLILVTSGDRVPADARIVEAVNLKIDEAALTGESEAVSKDASALPNVGLALGDRKNMLYAGTAATYGRGQAIVVATGMDTEFGKIATMLETVEPPKTHLQENLDRIGTILARVAIVVVAAIVIAGMVRRQPFMEMFIFGIALAVAVVPEALPAVVTISMALGVQRMARRNALMRRLSAVEALGGTSVICSDKTGTLTKDEMTVRKLFVESRFVEVTGSGYKPEGEFRVDGLAINPTDALKDLLRASGLASDAHIVRNETGEWDVKGDPTEGALIVAAAKAGLHKRDLDDRFPRIGEIPFTSETKRMTTWHQTPDGAVAFSKGAPEVIVASCNLDSTAHDSILAAAAAMAGDALRVLAVARKSDNILETAEHGMTFLGLIGMIDPPRPEAKLAVEKCESAGIKTVMITGDHPLTARAVARELRILNTGRVVTGPELEAMSDEELEREVDRIEVYARVSPAHKLRVVTALQKNRHVVAMTGDGANDAPALKKSDVGIAMGITGTDVSKEAAAMTLTDDNFSSIVAAVEEGRHIFGNIKKYLMYLLSSNLGEIGLIAAATFAGMPLPLSAVQILYINLATDGLPALALAVDPPEPDLMRHKPVDPQRGIFTRSVVVLVFAGGIWSTIANFTLYRWTLMTGRSIPEAMTMTFVALVLTEFFKAYNFRSDRRSVLDRPFANKWLNLAILWELIVLAVVVYVSWAQRLLGTFALTTPDWIIAITAAVSICPVLEITKRFVSK